MRELLISHLKTDHRAIFHLNKVTLVLLKEAIPKLKAIINKKLSILYLQEQVKYQSRRIHFTKRLLQNIKSRIKFITVSREIKSIHYKTGNSEVLTNKASSHSLNKKHKSKPK